MMRRLFGRLPHIAKLPVDGGFVPVAVLRMTLQHCRWWHTHVQPVIDAEVAERADKKWVWPRLYRLTRAVSVARSCHGLVVAAVTTTPQGLVPLAMTRLVLPWPHLPERRRRSAFVWYLTTAPRQATAALLPSLKLPKAVGSAALDVAVTESFNRLLQGRSGCTPHARAARACSTGTASKGRATSPATFRFPGRCGGMMAGTSTMIRRALSLPAANWTRCAHE